MSLCFLGYGGAAALHGSGFAAVYVAALVLGNSELPHRVATRSFAEGVAWLAQIGLFVMLGLLLSPDELTLSTVWLALLAGLVLTLVARPLSVLASAVIAPLPLRELSFLSWAGLTGPTLPLVAKVLKVARRSEPRGLEVEVAPLERVAADLLQVTISPVSKMHGVEVGELRLPVGASVSLVIRAGQILVPERRTVLRHGDDLLVVTPRKLRELTEERLRQVSSSGRLAQWLSRPPRDTT
jgi:cell volume regulation protein A